MSENNYGALMLKSALAAPVNLTAITEPGVYPVNAGNVTAPNVLAGELFVTSQSLRSFISITGDHFRYINKAWVRFGGSAALDVGTVAGTVAAGNDSRIVNAVPNTRKINGHALNADASLTAGDVGAYTKPEGDTRYQPKGNYTPAGEAYTKAASDAAYAPKTSVYTKTESDGRYPTKDGASTLGFVSGVATNPYMRHATSNTVISLATTTALNTVSGVADAAKAAAAAAQTTANTGVTNAANAAKAAAAAQTTANAAAPKTTVYTKTEADGRFQAKGSYTPAGEAYTKAVSDGRYLSTLQRGSQSLQNGAHSFLAVWEAPTGCFMTGVHIRNDLGDCRNMGYYYRALMMKTVSGSWVQIGN